MPPRRGVTGLGHPASSGQSGDWSPGPSDTEGPPPSRWLVTSVWTLPVSSEPTQPSIRRDWGGLPRGQGQPALGLSQSWGWQLIRPPTLLSQPPPHRSRVPPALPAPSTQCSGQRHLVQKTRGPPQPLTWESLRAPASAGLTGPGRRAVGRGRPDPSTGFRVPGRALIRAHSAPVLGSLTYTMGARTLQSSAHDSEGPSLGPG